MIEQNVTVTFGYGAMSPSLEEQARSQGFSLGDKAEHLEKLRDAKTRLMFHVLTDSQTKAIEAKIHKLVIKSLKPLGEVKAATCSSCKGTRYCHFHGFADITTPCADCQGTGKEEPIHE